MWKAGERSTAPRAGDSRGDRDIRDSSRPSAAPVVAARMLRLTWPGEELFRTCSSGGMLSSECCRETRSLSNTPNKPMHKIQLQGCSLPYRTPLRPARTPQPARHTANPWRWRQVLVPESRRGGSRAFYPPPVVPVKPISSPSLPGERWKQPLTLDSFCSSTFSLCPCT